jgi:hypothetical protein
VRSEQRTRDLQRFVAAFDHKHTVIIEPQLRKLRAPTLIGRFSNDRLRCLTDSPQIWG